MKATIRSLFSALACLLLLGLSSCALHRRDSNGTAGQTKTVEPPAPPLFGWEDEDTTGRAAVKISLDEQKAYIFRGGKNVAWTMLASGVAGHNSPTGHFMVMEKIEHKTSNLYGVIANSDGEVVNWDAKAGVSRVPPGCHFVGAPMPHWMRITSTGVGMHAGVIPNPGMPASHGCIRLPEEMAKRLFEVVEVGTPVTISGSAPQG